MSAWMLIETNEEEEIHPLMLSSGLSTMRQFTDLQVGCASSISSKEDTDYQFMESADIAL